MSEQRIVVIGASAGGLAALRSLISRLGRNFPAPVLVVMHVCAERRSMLPVILTRAGDVPAVHAADGDRLAPGRILVAPPGFHLIVRSSSVCLSVGPKENGFRPSVDVVFRSAACAYGEGAIGVVLSGALDDGASGLYAIKRLGGIAIVQDPDEAEYASMPFTALQKTTVDRVAGAAEIGRLLNELIQTPPTASPADEHTQAYRKQLEKEVSISATDSAFHMGIMDYAEPTRYTCPSCHGVLFKIAEGDAVRFRCHTGHGFTLASLMQEHRVHLEDKLWQGVMSLQESIALFEDAAERLEAAGDASGATDMRAKAEEAKEHADNLRRLTLRESRQSSED